MTHGELVDRALRWLANKRCNPIFNNCASCSEIPDAIGWSSSWKMRGSVVIECKASRPDFYADKKKRFQWRHPQWNHTYSASRLGKKAATKEGWVAEPIPLMGDFRYYLSVPGVITQAMVEEHAPDHGLLLINGRRIDVARIAPKIDAVNYPAEVRYLRFCIINKKEPFGDREGK